MSYPSPCPCAVPAPIVTTDMTIAAPAHRFKLPIIAIPFLNLVPWSSMASVRPPLVLSRSETGPDTGSEKKKDGKIRSQRPGCGTLGGDRVQTEHAIVQPMLQRGRRHRLRSVFGATKV